MKLIIDFYKGLDTLNLIIFWGIIIVIILLLIFSVILMNKNKKLKIMVEQKNQNGEELPIKKDEINMSEMIEEEKMNEQNTEEKDLKHIETENEFVVEEHIINYTKSSVELTENENDLQEEKKPESIHNKKDIELPTGPYQRNVLREMSLSQTSPIGINRQESKVDPKTEIAKDLAATLNSKELDEVKLEQEMSNNIKEVNNDIKKEEQQTNFTYYESTNKEILDEQSTLSIDTTPKSASEKYLEEVSRKLAEAEVPDEVERTNYELQQEEDAIISYKELMEKKDSIQTVDEEEAVISIEELMNRTNRKHEDVKEDIKLYHLSAAEENDDFIKELKQFRNDL